MTLQLETGFVSEMHIRNESGGINGCGGVKLGDCGGMYGKEEQVGRKNKEGEGSVLFR